MQAHLTMGVISIVTVIFKTWDPFLKGPKKFLHQESHSKISNLMISELCYSHILNMDRGSTPSVRRTHLSVLSID